MATLRYTVAAIAGLGLAVLVWGQVAVTHQIFTTVSWAGLIPGWLAGIIGGFAAAVISPRHKWLVAILLGVAACAVLLYWIGSRELWAGSRNPLQWYWPAWLPLAFALGGFLGRGVWVMPPNKSLERMRGR